MKVLASGLLIALTLASPLRAIVLTTMEYVDSYTQTSVGATKDYQTVLAFIYLGTEYPEDTAESAMAFRPDGSEMNLLSSAPNPVLPFYFWYDMYTPPQEAPVGDYTFAFAGGTRDGTTEALTIDPRPLPPITQLTPHSFKSLSEADVSAPIRLVFTPLPQQGGRGPAAAGFADGLTTKVVIMNDQSGNVFEAPTFDPRTATLTIPAGVLKPATSYYFLLYDQIQYHNTPIYIVHYRELSFRFVTAAIKPQ